jgi:Flp pilus assembly pilin Flp
MKGGERALRQIKKGGEKMRRDFKKAQSIVEYTLLLGAVIAVIVVVLLSQGGIKTKVEEAYNATGQALNRTVANLTFGVFQN